MIQNRLLFATVILFALNLSAAEKIVGLKKAFVREKGNFLSKTVGNYKYGDRVKTETPDKDVWFKVKIKDKKGKEIEGWMHKSSFGSKRSILTDLGKGTEASNKTYKDEVVAAGKGFSEEYEKIYSKKNPKANFKQLDEIEKKKPQVDSILAFAKEGGLKSELLGNTEVASKGSNK